VAVDGKKERSGSSRGKSDKGRTKDRSESRGRRGRRGRKEPKETKETKEPEARTEPAPKGDGVSSTEAAGGDGAPAKGGQKGRSGSRRADKRRRWKDRRQRRKHKPGKRPAEGRGKQDGKARPSEPAELTDVEGMLVVEKAHHGHLRLRDNDYLPAKTDVHVAPRIVQQQGLREGAIVAGRGRKGHGRHKWELVEVVSVDGKDPKEVRNLTPFKKLVSIDPDFHYAVGDSSGEVSLKVVDLICPIGRGQRGLIVAPPRSGKTVLMQQFAKAVEKTYPEVHLVVLLVDERPEEATEWRRSLETRDVFVSTNDESSRKHVELCEAVWKRCRRMVELGEDVILILDSITRVGRAYNHIHGTSGKTMSGGIDTRALERPKQFFGAARNTETAGSLTILGTTLIETGSRMDQVIFEEFKGTGNMELILARKLADRRIFPALDIEKSGTRKDEKLISSSRLRRIVTLRRVLAKMHWAEAMELLIGKLMDVEKTDEFLDRFEIDPEA